MQRLSLLLLLLIGIYHPAAGQRFTISGVVTDATSGETLVGVNLYAAAAETGTATNAYGFYSLTLPAADSVALIFSYVGYEPQLKKIYLTRNVRLDIGLVPSTEFLDEVMVTAERSAIENVRSTQMSVVDVPIRLVERLPAIFGEADVLKVIQLLPGVQSGNEGTTGFHVRGGNTDQNLVELDEAVIYNPNHLFGLFSTFNSRALSNVELVKGGFPAQYGGRLSSVLRVKMREGNRREFAGTGGIGLISSNLMIEGPIVKDRLSYMVSGRRSYLDLVIRPFQSDRIYYFYDLNAKLNWQAGENDRLYLSGFDGRDNAEYVDATGLGYGIRFGNSTGTFRWNHIFGDKLFGNLSLIANRYAIEVKTIQGPFYSQNYSGIRDLTAKAEFEYYPAPRHNIRIGGVATRHRFKSSGTGGELPSGGVVTTIDPNRVPERYAGEYAVYLQDDWNSSERIGLSVGVRIPYYTSDDTSYAAVEPRVSIRVGIDPQTSAKASYTRMNQFVHLVPSTTASLPTDIWTPASRVARPQTSTQYALGLFRNFGDGRWETSVEGYYKDMQRQVLFREGTQLLAYRDIERQLTFGRGWSYGAELYAKRNGERLTGWVSYTLSRTEQRFSELNRGESFPFRYDRTHNLAIAGTYRLSDRWEISGNFVFLTGPSYTLPVGRVYASLGGELYQGLFYDYDRVNNYRMRPTHRLDLSFAYKVKPRFFTEGELVFGAYNAYSHQNPYYVFLDLDLATREPIAQQVSLLPIVPNVSYNVRF